jgi:hypothetical protein
MRRTARRGSGVTSSTVLLLALTACIRPWHSTSQDERRVRVLLEATSHLNERLPAGGSLVVDELRFDEVNVAIHADTAEVLARVEASGSSEGIPLHYLGSEHLSLHREAGGYRGELVPALVGVLDALQRRQQAIAAGDRTGLIALAGSDYRDGSVDRAGLPSLVATLWPTIDRARPAAMAIRVDADRAVLALSFEVDGGSRTHTVELRKQANSWRYSAGLL